ncbi:hypothetical protein T4A_7806 [Trichinella pseudospiralis]|uniref:Uncharacterized protein n=1 Tax=Trichinella pseudospiralis TaxID=6337 RepID=A0A0V1AK02_TRIPS|nr:hypothetical protein T4A_13338 [Trichinella pseudospiralis]KRY25167.1 hypothetical protein T4A_7806 [Trichinella pseudospiralis]
MNIIVVHGAICYRSSKKYCTADVQRSRPHACTFAGGQLQRFCQ